MIDYSIVRSKRKTLSIHIKKNVEVEVRAPLRLSESVISDFVNEKELWILKHLDKMKERVASIEAFELKEGDELQLLGRKIPLVFWEKQETLFDGRCFYVKASTNSEIIKSQLVGLYRQIARESIGKKVDYYAKIMGVHPTGVKINGAKTRWGSCSGKNSLNFSWKLVMAPEDAVNYVVVHELSHILEHNHSSRFWKIVEIQMPDFEQRKEKLKQFAQKLSREDWDES